MAKLADKYFEIDSWNIIEDGFDPEYSMVAESIFSLGNEYMGVRGYFEEGYSGKTLLGSYFNGVYESQYQEGPGYKGIVHETEFMVNAVDWLYTEIYAGEEKLDLASCDYIDYKRVLHMRNGLLTRSFIWNTHSGGQIQITLERFISMTNNEIGAQRVILKSLSYDGAITVRTGLNFDTYHGSDKQKLWNCHGQSNNGNEYAITGETIQTKKQIKSSCRITGTIAGKDSQVYLEDKKVYGLYTFSLTSGETETLEKVVCNITSFSQGMIQMEAISDFIDLLNQNEEWWSKVWESSDIEIFGDEENQQGIRFCIFQMFQTYHGAVEGTNIGAKGLTGEAYNGNAFWDTETYCLPFFLFLDKQAARNLLYFRYATLEEAKKRAEELDCKGAFYPIATISGKECCNLWQHASLQLQASTGVAYGIWLYEKIIGDMTFAEEYGMEMLIEICRMLAGRGDYNADDTYYGYYGVMGPDEFQMMVNHNCYTNYMARFTFRYTIDVVNRMRRQNSKRLQEVLSKTGCEVREIENWRKLAEDMYIPYDAKTGLYEQHKGYFDLPHVDVNAIPMDEFPLYHHWTYDRIYRNDMIKQPDVLMMMLLFISSFTDEEISRNYEFYEPKCIHESSLSPSVHSILAAQVNKQEEAYDFFGFATRMDLDNYNRNTHEGLHTTSIAAAWMNIVYGFGGLRSDGDVLSMWPSLPEKWKGYKFRIRYQEDVICMEVNQEKVKFHTLNGKQIKIKIYGKEVFTKEEKQETNLMHYIK